MPALDLGLLVLGIVVGSVIILLAVEDLVTNWPK
jgi:hypothetical protein